MIPNCAPRGLGSKKWWICSVPIVLAMVQVKFYFVREMLVAELLFLLAFVFLSAVGAVCYLLGAIGERSRLLVKQTAVEVIRMSTPSKADSSPAKHARIAVLHSAN